MAYLGWATHVPQGPPQRAATAKAGATPKAGLSPDCALQPARMKLEPLVIADQDDAVKLLRALHTSPITLGKLGGSPAGPPTQGEPAQGGHWAS